jgi:hypothetical protein
MIKLKYPSKRFIKSAQDAIEKGEEFCVEARLGRYRKKSLQDYINKMFLGKGGRFSYIGMAMCADLGGCTANAYISGKYSVQFSDSETGMLLTFKRTRGSH